MPAYKHNPSIESSKKKVQEEEAPLYAQTFVILYRLMRPNRLLLRRGCVPYPRKLRNTNDDDLLGEVILTTLPSIHPKNLTMK